MGSSITGLNHVTLAVRDLARSVAFYRDVLGCTLRAMWNDGAYFEAGSLWLCLSHDAEMRASPRDDYSHLAFSVAGHDYARLSKRLHAECAIWKDNGSEGASTYFLDPDGHKLEIHLGSLESRLAHYRARDMPDMQMFEASRPVSIVTPGVQYPQPFTDAS